MVENKVNEIIDLNIERKEQLSSPLTLKRDLPSSFNDKVNGFRNEIKNILDGKDNRIMIIAGPCSIHSEKEAEEYAYKLKELSDKVNDKFLIIMRAYFEKPRTVAGWKGLIYDPTLDETYDIEKGIKLARTILLNISEIGLPIATEFLGHVTPQYMDDLISWAAIGARTTESQTHREIASGLSMPVGFKNDTKGNSESAINAIKSANMPHSFLGIDVNGQSSIFRTKGNKYCHLILRGGEDNENFFQNYKDANAVAERMKKEGIIPNLIIDCSHGNSSKDYRNQPNVFFDVIESIASNESKKYIKGVMLESNINEGNQKLSKENMNNLKHGVSITDSCISWETTERIILEAHKKL